MEDSPLPKAVVCRPQLYYPSPPGDGSHFDSGVAAARLSIPIFSTVVVERTILAPTVSAGRALKRLTIRPKALCPRLSSVRLLPATVPPFPVFPK